MTLLKIEITMTINTHTSVSLVYCTRLPFVHLDHVIQTVDHVINTLNSVFLCF